MSEESRQIAAEVIPNIVEQEVALRFRPEGKRPTLGIPIASLVIDQLGSDQRWAIAVENEKYYRALADHYAGIAVAEMMYGELTSE